MFRGIGETEEMSRGNQGVEGSLPTSYNRRAAATYVTPCNKIISKKKCVQLVAIRDCPRESAWNMKGGRGAQKGSLIPLLSRWYIHTKRNNHLPWRSNWTRLLVLKKKIAGVQEVLANMVLNHDFHLKPPFFPSWDSQQHEIVRPLCNHYEKHNLWWIISTGLNLILHTVQHLVLQIFFNLCTSFDFKFPKVFVPRSETKNDGKVAKWGSWEGAFRTDKVDYVWMVRFHQRIFYALELMSLCHET